MDLYFGYNPRMGKNILVERKGFSYKQMYKIINQPKFSMLDDHTPFLEKGFRAVDMIDFDYPDWHTTGDTSDKVSSESLEVIGNTLWHWLVDPK
jgi:hypothetical protein